MHVTTCLCCVLFIRQIVLIKKAQGCTKLLYQDQCWSASIWVTSSLEIRFSLSLPGFNTTFAVTTWGECAYESLCASVCSNLFWLTGFKGQQLSFSEGHLRATFSQYAQDFNMTHFGFQRLSLFLFIIPLSSVSPVATHLLHWVFHLFMWL